MKKYFGLIFVIVFCACQKQQKTLELPIEKFYIVEYGFKFPEDFSINDTLSTKIKGFCELDKNFNLKLSFTDTIKIIEDSLKNKIIDIISKYPTDTTFSAPPDMWYCGQGINYIFILEKQDNTKTKIYFYPEFLPEDLLFLYKFFYEDNKINNYIINEKDEYKDLFKEFDSIILSDTSRFEKPPKLMKTIKIYTE